jgi:hypothetical protein
MRLGTYNRSRAHVPERRDVSGDSVQPRIHAHARFASFQEIVEAIVDQPTMIFLVPFGLAPACRSPVQYGMKT